MLDTRDEFWRLVSFVEMSKNRQKALLLLHESDTPLTPTELSTKMEIAFNNASRAVRQLASEDLVKCVNPDAPRFRRYRLTEKGQEVAQELAEEKE